MSGFDTVRGIAYQQAQAVLVALDVLDDVAFTAMRVEGVDDIVDLEIFTADESVAHAKQVKTKAEPYTWSEAQLVSVLRRWANLSIASGATFEFLTDGRLGPTGERVAQALEAAAEGRLEVLADILGEDISSPVCRALATARIRTDPAGVGALVSRAELQIAAMLPHVRTHEDARERAQRAVSALFLLLFERAGDADPLARVVTRQQIASTLDVEAEEPRTVTQRRRWRARMSVHHVPPRVHRGTRVPTPRTRRLRLCLAESEPVERRGWRVWSRLLTVAG